MQAPAGIGRTRQGRTIGHSRYLPAPTCDRSKRREPDRGFAGASRVQFRGWDQPRSLSRGWLRPRQKWWEPKRFQCGPSG